MLFRVALHIRSGYHKGKSVVLMGLVVCVIISFDLRDRILAVFYGKFIYSAIYTYNQELRDNVSQPF